MIFLKQKIAPLLCGMILMCSLTGCRGIVITTEMSNTELFKVSDCVCSMKEALVYLTTIQNEYKDFYGVNLWDSNIGVSAKSTDDSLVDEENINSDEALYGTDISESLESYIKNKTMYRLQHIYCMYLLALENGIELTEEEEAAVSKAAETFISSLNDSEKSYFGISQEDVVEYYSHYLYAQKVYDSVTADVDVEISDDTARVMQARVIFTTDAEKANNISSQLSTGEDFSVLAAKYSSLSYITAYVSRGEMPEAVESVLFTLNEGESSGCITTEEGYYFVNCVSRIDEEKTEENRQEILNKTCQDMFNSTYDEFISGVEFEINEASWDELELTDDESITTDSFFSTYNEALDLSE